MKKNKLIKILTSLTFFLFLSCANNNHFSVLRTAEGANIPKFKKHEKTVCRPLVLQTPGNTITKNQQKYGFDYQICIELWTGTQYRISPLEWEKIKHLFVHYSLSAINNEFATANYLKDEFNFYLDNNPNLLKDLENFIRREK